MVKTLFLGRDMDSIPGWRTGVLFQSGQEKLGKLTLSPCPYTHTHTHTQTYQQIHIILYFTSVLLYSDF